MRYVTFCRSEVRVLKEADEAVGALSALFGGGSQSGNLGNMTIAGGPSGLASMLSGKVLKYIRVHAKNLNTRKILNFIL